MKVRIGGWKEVSLVDVLESTSFSVWFNYCNFNCPWCSNISLARNISGRTVDTSDIIKAFSLSKDLVEYFHVTGGEPTLQPKPLKELFLRIKNEFYVFNSLDTNGSNPSVLKDIIGLIDHLAIDIKSPLNDLYKFSKITGVPLNLSKIFIERIKKSLTLSLNVDFLELRTTIIPGIINVNDVKQIGVDIKEIAEKFEGNRIVYVLQQYVPYASIINKYYRNLSRTSISFLKKLGEVLVYELPDNIEIYIRTLEEGAKKISEYF